MWQNPATQRNVAQLRARRRRSARARIPGAQACGEVGDGRMLEAVGHVRSDLRVLPAEDPARPARAADRRADVRTARSGARHHEPLVAARWASRSRARPQQAGADVHLIAGPGRAGNAVGRVSRGRADRAADVRRRDARDAGHRHLHRGGRRRRLARRSRERAQDQEDGRPARCRRSASSRIRTFSPRSRSCRIRRTASASRRKAAISTCTAKKSACARTCRF